MPGVIYSVAAADLAFGNDLIDKMVIAQSWVKKALNNRVYTYVGLKGSAAAQDMAIAIKVDGKTQDIIYNSGTGGFTAYNSDLKPTSFKQPKDSIISNEVVDAGGTNAGYVALIWLE